MTSAISSPFRTTDEVAELLRIPSETLRYWRHIGYGPKSFKMGRRVLYRDVDVEAFVEAAIRGESA